MVIMKTIPILPVLLVTNIVLTVLEVNITIVLNVHTEDSYIKENVELFVQMDSTVKTWFVYLVTILVLLVSVDLLTNVNVVMLIDTYITENAYKPVQTVIMLPT